MKIENKNTTDYLNNSDLIKFIRIGENESVKLNVSNNTIAYVVQRGGKNVCEKIEFEASLNSGGLFSVKEELIIAIVSTSEHKIEITHNDDGSTEVIYNGQVYKIRKIVYQISYSIIKNKIIDFLRSLRSFDTIANNYFANDIIRICNEMFYKATPYTSQCCGGTEIQLPQIQCKSGNLTKYSASLKSAMKYFDFNTIHYTVYLEKSNSEIATLVESDIKTALKEFEVKLKMMDPHEIIDFVEKLQNVGIYISEETIIRMISGRNVDNNNLINKKNYNMIGE